MYWAEVRNGAVVAILESRREMDRARFVPIDSYDESLLGASHDSRTGFTAPTAPPAPHPRVRDLWQSLTPQEREQFVDFLAANGVIARGRVNAILGR